MRTWLLVLIVAVQAQAAAAQAPPAGQGTSAAQTSSSQASQAGKPAGDVQWPVSLDKIWKELQEAPPPPGPSLKIGELPTFRVTVYGQRKPLLPDFSASLKQEWQPVVPGGINNMEIMNMITPPQARPFQAHINGDLVGVAASALVFKLFERAMIAGYEAVRQGWRSSREQRIHEEVAAELAAFLLANPQPPAAAAEVKK